MTRITGLATQSQFAEYARAYNEANAKGNFALAAEIMRHASEHAAALAGASERAKNWNK